MSPTKQKSRAMKPDHERIWLQPGAGDCGETTWCQDRIHDDDIEYIRADIHARALLSAHQRGMEEAASVARCAFDDRPRRDSMDWNDGFDDGTKAAEYAIRSKAQEAAKEGK